MFCTCKLLMLEQHSDSPETNKYWQAVCNLLSETSSSIASQQNWNIKLKILLKNPLIPYITKWKKWFISNSKYFPIIRMLNVHHLHLVNLHSAALTQLFSLSFWVFPAEKQNKTINSKFPFPLYSSFPSSIKGSVKAII